MIRPLDDSNPFIHISLGSIPLSALHVDSDSTQLALAGSSHKKPLDALGTRHRFWLEHSNNWWLCMMNIPIHMLCVPLHTLCIPIAPFSSATSGETKMCMALTRSYAK